MNGETMVFGENREEIKVKIGDRILWKYNLDRDKVVFREGIMESTINAISENEEYIKLDYDWHSVFEVSVLDVFETSHTKGFFARLLGD